MLQSFYGPLPVRNPFGKASGQLSLNTNHVSRDAEAGLGFCVLKTVVAQDERGAQSMGAWAIPATRMLVEPIRGTRVDETGWTVTWKGRGWSGTFQEYLEFFKASIVIGKSRGMVVVPSCTFHVPSDTHGAWNIGEYEYTVNALLDVWGAAGGEGPMPLEKDFSPTLAGSDVAMQKEAILRWIDEVPRLIRSAAGSREIILGMKIFNALFDDDFQVEMLMRCIMAPIRGDFIVYGNRLFDPRKEFDGTRGVAYGGPDLSARNLSVLDKFLAIAPKDKLLPISATGNIDSGRRAAEYLLRGCSSFQVHTLFQLPDSHYTHPQGTKLERAMHDLIHHPEHGFIRALSDMRSTYGWPEEWGVGEIAEWCAGNRSYRENF